MPGVSPGYLAQLVSGGGATGLLLQANTAYSGAVIAALVGAPAGTRVVSLDTDAGSTQGHIYQSNGVAWVDVATMPLNAQVFLSNTGTILVFYFNATLAANTFAPVGMGLYNSTPIDAVISYVAPVAAPGNTSPGIVGFASDPAARRTGPIDIVIAAPGDVGVATFTWAFQGGAPSAPILTAASVNITDGAGFSIDVTFVDVAGPPSFVAGDSWQGTLVQDVQVDPGTLYALGAFDLLTPSMGNEQGLRFVEYRLPGGGAAPMEGFMSVVGPAAALGYTQGLPIFAYEAPPGTFTAHSVANTVDTASLAARLVNPDAINALDGKVVVMFRRVHA